jgi:hypothetical protein
MKKKIIDEDTELIPGMLIEKCPGECFRVIMGRRFRDCLAVCIDEDGHTVLVSAWDGEYSIKLDGHKKVLIAYGEISCGEIKISEEYYYDEQDFKNKNSQAQFWYVEALRGTERIVGEKAPKVGVSSHSGEGLKKDDWKACFKHDIQPSDYKTYKRVKTLLEKMGD